MIVIHENPDGNWTIECDWSIPETIHIENGEIQLLRDELCRIFGLPDDI